MHIAILYTDELFSWSLQIEGSSLWMCVAADIHSLSLKVSYREWCVIIDNRVQNFATPQTKGRSQCITLLLDMQVLSTDFKRRSLCLTRYNLMK